MLFHWRTLVEAATRLFCIAVVAVQLVYLDILLLPMHTGYGHYEWILWLLADVIVLGTFFYSLLRLVRLLQWKQSRIRFQQQREGYVPEETEMLSVNAQRPLLSHAADAPPTNYVTRQPANGAATANGGAMLANSADTDAEVRPIFSIRTAGTIETFHTAATSSNIQDLHADQNNVSSAAGPSTADSEPVLNGLRRRTAHSDALAAAAGEQTSSAAARGSVDVTDFPAVLFRQHLPNEPPPPSAVLPVAYAAWLVYAVVMIVRLWVFFKRFARLLQVPGFFGTNMLKIMIGLSAAVYALLVSSHRRQTVSTTITTRSVNNNNETSAAQTTTTTESRVDYYLRYMQKSVAFEILDSIQLLTILFIHESRMLLSFELESVILAFACMPLVLPVLPLLQMSSVRFVRRGVDYYPTEMFSVCYALLYTLLVNVPYLVIRVYLWNTFNYETELFIVKNIIGIVQSLWSALMALPVCSDACKRHKILYWCCMHCCTKNSNQRHDAVNDEAEIEREHQNTRRIPTSAATTTSAQPPAGANNNVQPNILHIKYTPSPNPERSLPPNITTNGHALNHDLINKPTIPANSTTASELERYYARETSTSAVDSINLFTAEDFYYNCQKAHGEGVGVVRNPKELAYPPEILLSRAATVPSALEHTAPPFQAQYSVELTLPGAGDKTNSSSGVGHSFTSSMAALSPQPNVNINSWSTPRGLDSAGNLSTTDILMPTPTALNAGPHVLIEPHTLSPVSRALLSYPSSDMSAGNDMDDLLNGDAEAGDSVAMLPKIVVRHPPSTRNLTSGFKSGGGDAMQPLMETGDRHDESLDVAAEAVCKPIFFINRQESEYL